MNFNICFCIDEGVTEYLPTTINSIVKNNPEKKINFHFIYENKPNSFDRIVDFISRFNLCKVFSYKKSWNYHFNGLHHTTKTTMLRLLIPDTLTVKGKLLYLDIDLIVNCDINKLFNYSCENTGFALRSSNEKVAYRTSVWKMAYGISGNCGVALMDLDILRKNSFTQQAIEIVKNKTGILYRGQTNDQWVINKYCEGAHTKLNRKFNIFSNHKETINDSKNFILHWAGEEKPWGNSPTHHQKYWEKYKVELS